MSKKEVILVIAAHPDDEILGVGSTIRKFVNEGAIAHAVILAEGITSRSERREYANLEELQALRRDAKRAASIIGYDSIEFCDFPDNRMDSVCLLDVIKTVSKYVNMYNPSIIFTHHSGDLNIDHRITCNAVLTACRPVGDNPVKKIYSFETPSSTEWDYSYLAPFNPNAYVDITDTIDAKINGMSCYKSESKPSPHPRSKEALIALAEYRGSNIGTKYSEAFYLLREIM